MEGAIDHTDPDVLYELYVDKQMSTTEIGGMVGLTGAGITYWLEKHGIERRGRGESNKSLIASLRTDNDGYERWSSSNGRDQPRETAAVHRLLVVSEHGFETIKGCEVHHKNGIPWDNRPSNLKVVTRAEHMREHGNIGSGHPNSKLTESEVREIKQRLKKGDTQTDIANEFNIHQGTVSTIKRGEVWGHVTPEPEPE